MSTAIYVSYLQKDPKTGEPYKFDVDYYLNTHMRLVQEHWCVRACWLAFHFPISPYSLFLDGTPLQMFVLANLVKGAPRHEVLAGDPVRGR